MVNREGSKGERGKGRMTLFVLFESLKRRQVKGCLG